MRPISAVSNRIVAVMLTVLCSEVLAKDRDAISAPTLAVDKKAVVVTVHDLTENPAKYAGHFVRVTGYWIQAFEYSALHPEAKMTEVSSIWVERWSLPGMRVVRNPLAISAALEAAYKEAGQDQPNGRDVLLVTLEGYFDHRASIEGTKESYPFKSGYGHLGQYSSLLTVERVIEVKFVTKEPYPL